MATWKRTHSGDYTAYVIQVVEGTVDAWIEQAGSKRNAVSALNSVAAAMALVGHRTESIYRRYAIVDAGALRDAAAKIDDAVGTLSGTLATNARSINDGLPV